MSFLLLAEPLAHKTGEAAKAGPIGLAVIILLCVACYFLFKSMSKHLRNVRERFPEQDAAGGGELASRPEGPVAQQHESEHVVPRGDLPRPDDV
jgi:hypothetical protein